MLIASVVYGVSGAAVVAATNHVVKIVQETETKVEFAPPPEPEPPPPPPPPPQETPRPQPARKLVRRQDMPPPDKISDEKLKESNKALVASGDTGPVDGFLTGTLDGKGSKAPAAPPPPPPPPKAVPLVPAVAVATDQPRYPAPAKRKGIEGSVVVDFDVLEDGHVANPKIVSGPPEFAETVMKTVVTWRFKPAMRDGKPVRYRMRKTITFRLEDA